MAAMMVTWTCAQEARRRYRPMGGGTGPVSVASGPGSDLGNMCKTTLPH